MTFFMVDQTTARPVTGRRDRSSLMRAMRIAFLAVACCRPFSSSLPAFAAQLLAPHRAVYDLALDKASDRSGITGITGRMVYEFNGSACEGYTVTFRFVTRIDTGDTTQAHRPADDDVRGCRGQDLQLRHQILRRPEPRQGDQGHRHQGRQGRQGRDRKAGAAEHRPRDDTVSDAASGRSPRQGRYRRHVSTRRACSTAPRMPTAP